LSASFAISGRHIEKLNSVIARDRTFVPGLSVRQIKQHLAADTGDAGAAPLP
jgi:hypothetical protein